MGDTPKPTYDPVIAERCPARFDCKQHRILCGTACGWFTDIRYQVEMAEIPKRHTKWDVERLPDDTEHRAIFMQYADDGLLDRVARGKGLYLYGSVGNGKTTAACAIALSYILRRSLSDIRTGSRTSQLVQFVSVPDFLDQIRAGFDHPDKRPSIDRKLHALSHAPLAIMDDLGAEKPTEWVRERLLTIIGARYDKELTTIVTSNLTPAELVEPLGARLASRVQGMTAPIKFVGTDRRRKV